LAKVTEKRGDKQKWLLTFSMPYREPGQQLVESIFWRFGERFNTFAMQLVPVPQRRG
jgi:hypothetical protein